MPENVHAPSGQPGRLRIRNSQDFYGGLVMVAIAALAFWASRDLRGMHGFALGPGTVPRMFAGTVGVLGLIITAIGLFSDGPKIDRVAVRRTLLGALLVVIYLIVLEYGALLTTGLGLRQYEGVLAALAVLLATMALARGLDRGLLYVVASTLIFAGTIRPLGLVFATFISLVVSAAATLEVRWRETIIWAAALTLFCTLVFVYGLSLPFGLWPTF